MNFTRVSLATVAMLLSSAVGVCIGIALATGAPQLTPLTYSGTVTDAAGKPYPVPQEVTLRFYDKPDATVPKCVAAPVQAEANSGRFVAVLPAECVQAVHDNPDLWSEATVGATKTVMPRVHVSALPYALEADTASKAGGQLKATLDAMAKEIQALKAAPASGGGGGPYVVDANGVKLGKLLTVEEPYKANSLGTLQWVGTEIYVFATSGGYYLRAYPDGVLLDQIGVVYYPDLNCGGAPTVGFNPSASNNPKQLSEKHAYAWGANFFALDLSASGAPALGQFTHNSSISSISLYKCSNYSKPLQNSGYPAHLLTPAQVGLPSVKLAGPLSIVP